MRIPLMLAVLLALVTPAARASFTIGSSTLDVVSGDTTATSTNTLSAGPLPWTDSHSVSTIFGSAATQYNFGTSGLQTDLDFQFQHVRSGLQYAYDYSQGSLTFSLTNNGTYDLTGDYKLFGADYVGMQVTLYDQTTSTMLFENQQASVDTPNESFTLGGVGGDLTPTLSGSPSGSLIGGHVYELTYLYMINSDLSDASFNAATADGYLHLVTKEEIPEPATLALLIAGLTPALGRRR